MDMRSTRSFKSKRKAITAVGGEEGKREEKISNTAEHAHLRSVNNDAAHI